MCDQNIHIASPTTKERYELVIKARNFHYENYSKWMTYFYVAIGSVFIAYYTLSSKEDTLTDKQLLLMALAILGFSISLLWYLSCKGYYYWNIHYITLINYYERDVFKWPVEQRVYFVFANKTNNNNYISPIRGANISTSKAAILFSFIVTVFWGFWASYRFFSSSYPKDCCNTLIVFSSLLTSIFVTIILSLLSSLCLNSKIDNMPNLEFIEKDINKAPM